MVGSARCADRRQQEGVPTKFALQPYATCGSLRAVRKTREIGILLLAVLCSASAQDQEKKLVDRLLKPDMYLPIRTLRTSGIPKWRIASRTAFPCGSSTAAFGITITLAFITAQYCGDLRRQGQSPPFISKLQCQECRSVGEHSRLHLLRRVS